LDELWPGPALHHHAASWFPRMTTIISSVDDHPWPSHDVAMPIEIGAARGTTCSVGVDGVVFASPASFEVGSAISFVILMAAETQEPVRLECRGVVTGGRPAPDGFETAATIETIRILTVKDPSP
jgi:hypothetical protein